MTSDEAVEDLLGSLHDLYLFDKRREELAARFATKLQPYIGQLHPDDYARIGTAIGEELKSFRDRYGEPIVPEVSYDETTRRITVSVVFPAAIRDIDLRLEI